jgi:acyl-coenzyme A thioesterase PaaI-like protein
VENRGGWWKKPRMARSDYAAILDRHVGKGEVLAGGVPRPELAGVAGSTVTGVARIAAPMMHGNRWPALYGGFLFDLARRAGALAVEAVADEAVEDQAVATVPWSLEIHFLRAVRRDDVPEPRGRSISWRARVTRSRQAEGEMAAVAIDIGEEDALLATAFATFAMHLTRDRMRASQEPLTERLVLPCHDAGWSRGQIAGRCMEAPGSLSAVGDTMLAKAAATVRGDGCPDSHEEHFLARTLSYTWIEPVDDGLASYAARLIHRGRRLGLAAADITLGGRPVGRITGTIVFQQVAR